MKPRAGLALLALLAAGCGGYEYVPDRAGLHAVAAGGGAGTLQVRAVRIAETMAPVDVTVRIAGQGLRGLQLRRAWLASRAAAPCSGGWQEDQALLEDRPQWARPAALEGDARLDLVFRDAWGVLSAPSVVDLDIEGGDGGRCLRLDLMTLAPDDPWQQGPWWLAFKLRSYFPLRQQAGTHDGHSFVLRFGRNFGPVNAGLSLEAGVAGCLGTCSDAEHYRGLMAAGPSLQVVLLDRGLTVLDLEAGYDFMSFQELAKDEDQQAMENSPSRFVHGPRLGLGLSRTVRRAVPGVIRDPRTRYGLELFVADRLRPSIEGGGRNLVLGLSFTMGGPI